MTFAVSFLFGGISTEYDSSISSLTHIISSYLTLSRAERPFSVKHMYHLSRVDGLVRTIPFHNAFTIAELQAHVSDIIILPGRSLPITFNTIESHNEYIVNLLHGQFGEDGGVQTLAALSGLKGTFGDPDVASLTMNKFAMSSFVSSLLPSDVMKVPKTRLVRPQGVDDAIRFAKSVDGSVVVKPNSLGASLFATRFHDPVASEIDIRNLLREIFKYDNTALLQEFIPGDEYSCGCLISSSDVVLLPVAKIETAQNFFGHEEKHSSGLVIERILDYENDQLLGRLTSITRRIASSIDLYNMARFDFRISNDREIWFLECNYIPGLMKNSIFPKMLRHHGMTVIELISWIASHSRQYERKKHFIEYEISE
ncbi:D-alanine--D-alanine ligase family protein [Mesorhizobium escarrei]|nr:D-alanine--D-alanine ligase [Mesorhizobium escarrei]